ncbi:dienelactone hydrolase family protein [Streptomyces sp. NPDC002787]
MPWHLLPGEAFALGSRPQPWLYPADQIDRLDEVLTAAGVRHRGEIYAGAHHGFIQAETAMHSPEATERHWTALLGLLGLLGRNL